MRILFLSFVAGAFSFIGFWVSFWMLANYEGNQAWVFSAVPYLGSVLGIFVTFKAADLLDF